MQFSCFYGITIILLVTGISIYDIVLTTTSISRTSYTATAFNNESATTQRPDESKINTSRVTALLSSVPVLQEFPVPPGARPHDVAPAADGIVWYTAQGSGELGWLDVSTNQTHHITLGKNGTLWFTGQSGIYGRLDPVVGQVEVFDAPRGRGPYGISTAPDGSIYYASLSGSYIARIDLETGAATVLEPPTPDQGARRVWPDSQGRIWVSEWNAGQVAVYNPATQEWKEWHLPGSNPMPYAVYVDDKDMVWLSDFGANAMVRFDPAQETFSMFSLPSPQANVRQILGLSGEVWGAESGSDKLVVIRSGD